MEYLFDKYKISLEVSMGERERRKLSIIRELCDCSIAGLPLAFFSGFFSMIILDFSAFASRVANAPRKLRYHQLCSPASLSTEWTQSGSLSSESSFRWSLSYVHSLTDRIMAYNRHTASRSISLSRISGYLNVEHCIVSAKHAKRAFLSIEPNILPYYTYSIARDFRINSSTATRMEIIKCLLLEWKELYFFSSSSDE